MSYVVLNNMSPRVKSIPYAQVELKAHQQAMVKRCLDIEKEVYTLAPKARVVSGVSATGSLITTSVQPSSDSLAFGLISSSAGSGKTFTVLSLVLADKHLKKTLTGRWGSGRASMATIIVAPSHLYEQWNDAIREFVGDALTVNRFNTYDDVMKLYREDVSVIHKSDIFLVSSLFYELVASTLKTIKVSFRRLVLDEIDSMSKTLNVALASDMTWFVSATINNIFTSNGFVRIGKIDPETGKNEYDLCLADLLKHEVVVEESFIAEGFKLPQPIHEVRLVPNEIVDDVLSHVLTPAALKAVNGCDTMDALTYAKITRNDQELVEELKTSWAHIHDENLSMIPRLKQHLDNCDDDMKRRPLINEIEQVVAIVKNTKAKLQIIHDRINALGVVPVPEERPKILAILKILTDPDVASQKILVFSQYPRTFQGIMDALKAKGIAYADMDGGNAKALAQAIDSYKTGTTNILFVHSAMFSCGCNLENTTHVVFMHKVDTLLKHQVIGRGQRPGRKGPLTIVEILHPNEKTA